MHTHPRGRTRRLGLRPVGVVVVGTRIAVATVVVGLSIFATAGTSGATVGVKDRCAPRPEADLQGCDFSHSNLTGANFKDSNLTAARFKEANLTDVNLRDANLTRANLTKANLEGAKLKDANFTDAALHWVTSGGTTGTPKDLPNGW